MVEINWIGGEHEFALRLGELRALQDKCDAGPEEVFNRLRLGTWRVDDILETIRLGLIGGGLEKAEARKVINTVEGNPLVQFKLVAITILADALIGVEDDPVGEPRGEVASPENGASPKSTTTDDI
ncbi:MAG: gene transfer agent family protein [Alphaproteobacteria bacterium]|uniref:Putative tail assembly chaperone n=1 Tax=viral metagenome TaxID=1070528 RepID=A0A6M3KBY0_9ZZZZ|nr:gene transfer agent family protein [Alphaproteobacteria bacterium]MBU1280260.1 gene transfer agent family protein [Alphaproteobacteria bacterium]MBU1572999.1 gene transfer agent family protein [Alphaproteobacteria bacterium]MBU1827218.1 gene transfer agent family protein [Alphaproteobacteria bacterium]MBU2079958.1 gene transfer agent family protein [Alphaproteobacteria bacterium]